MYSALASLQICRDMKTPSHHQLVFKFNNHCELSPFSHLKHRFFGVTSLQLMRQSLTTRQCTVISFKHGQLHICHTGTKQLSSSFLSFIRTEITTLFFLFQRAVAQTLSNMSRFLSFIQVQNNLLLLFILHTDRHQNSLLPPGLRRCPCRRSRRSGLDY